MDEINLPSTSASVTSSIEDAVNELLAMTNAAVDRLRKPQPNPPSSLSSASTSIKQDSLDITEPEDNLPVIHHPVIHPSDIQLPCDEKSFNQIVESTPIVDNQESRIIDVTKRLPNNSDESILEVGGSRPDSYSSTPQNIENMQLETPTKDLTSYFMAEEKSSALNKLLSPIEAGRGNDEMEEDICNEEVVTEDQNVVTNTLKLQVSNTSEESSTASEILIRSTRRQKLKQQVRKKVEIQSPLVSGEKEVEKMSVTSYSTQSSQSSSTSYQSVKIKKKNLKEVSRPKPNQLKTTGITQGHPVSTSLREPALKKDGDIQIQKICMNGRSQLRSIMTQKNSAAKKTIRPTFVNPPPQKQDSLSLVQAMSTLPVMQALSDLKSQTNHLSDKLSSMEQQKLLDVAMKQQDRNTEVDRKLNDVTNLRLHVVEQQQQQQTAWQNAVVRMMENIQRTAEMQKAVSTVPSSTYDRRGVRFENQENLMKTPAPRKCPPSPASMQKTGNGRLLQNILDQWDVSNTTLSPSIINPVTTQQKSPMKMVPEKLVSRTDGITKSPKSVVSNSNYLENVKKNAEQESERDAIARTFPVSIDQYLHESAVKGKLSGTPPPPTQLLKHPLVDKKKKTVPEESSSCVEDIWTTLHGLQESRKILESNLEIAERGRSRNTIATKLQYDILADSADADPDTVNKLRLKAMVEDEINKLQSKEQKSTTSIPAKTNSKTSLQSRRSKPTMLNKKPATLSNKQPPKRTKPKVPARNVPSTTNKPSDDYVDVSVADTEDYVTHVYGRADYHTRRSTVHKPFMHVKTPIKHASFRKKDAIETVQPSMIKSAKTQTSVHDDTPQRDRYYFSPTASPSKHTTQPVHGHLAPMAVPLSRPRVQDVQPMGLKVHIGEPKYVTVTTDTPKKKKIRIYDPSADVKKKSPVKKPDKPLEVHMLPGVNISCDSPSEVSEEESVEDRFPGTSVVIQAQHEDDDPCEPITLTGQAKPTCRKYTGPRYPPCPPPKSPIKSKDIATKITQDNVADEMKDWVEKELMARIISEVYAGGPCREDVGVNTDQASDLQLVCDAGLRVDDELARRLVEDELLKILRDTIRRKALDDEVMERETQTAEEEPKEDDSIHFYQPATPLPTPQPSPSESVVMEPTHIHTPSITPETSVAESIEIEIKPPEREIPQRVPTPPQIPPPESPEPQVIPVDTPSVTPRNTPTPPPEVAATPPRSRPPSISEVSSVEEVVQHIDPWEGSDPFDVMAQDAKKFKKPMTYAPQPEAVDLVVRSITPPPIPPDSISISTDTTPTSVTDNPDGTISEGQLVISHGEVRKKTKPGKIADMIGDLFSEGEVGHKFQSTMNDADDIEDYDPVSDGEVKLDRRPAMIKKISSLRGVGGDDPVGVYAPPRHPMPVLEEDDLSIGEVKKETMKRRHNKFKKWKEERSFRKSQSDSPQHQAPALSVGDLSEEGSKTSGEDDTLTNTKSLSLDGNVIRVVPKTDVNFAGMRQPQGNTRPQGGTVDSMDIGASLESGLLKDSLNTTAQSKGQDGEFDKNVPAIVVPQVTSNPSSYVEEYSEIDDVSEISGL